jgi:hypothetical protein
MPIDAAGHLHTFRNADGGFPPVAGAPSEPEPTALAAIALDDAGARDWLAGAQRDDGGFVVGPEALQNDSATPIAALALAPGAASDRAMDYLLGHRAPALDNDPRFPHDAATHGWGWTSKTFGWVEPTARGLLAVKVLRPAAGDVIADGKRVLADRECVGGGWNYGNRQVLGTNLEPYLQTTGAALIALQDPADPLVVRGLKIIDRLWPNERGGLGLSMALTAARLNGQARPKLAAALQRLLDDTELLQDGVSLAWAAIALGPRIAKLRVSR